MNTVSNIQVLANYIFLLITEIERSNCNMRNDNAYKKLLGFSIVNGGPDVLELNMTDDDGPKKLRQHFLAIRNENNDSTYIAIAYWKTENNDIKEDPMQVSITANSPIELLLKLASEVPALKKKTASVLRKLRGMSDILRILDEINIKTQFTDHCELLGGITIFMLGASTVLRLANRGRLVTMAPLAALGLFVGYNFPLPAPTAVHITERPFSSSKCVLTFVLQDKTTGTFSCDLIDESSTPQFAFTLLETSRHRPYNDTASNQALEMPYEERKAMILQIFKDTKKGLAVVC
jgi:hypothetical protein